MKMKMRVSVAACLASLALVAGCGKNKAVKAAEDMADAVCACKDTACAAAAAKKGEEALAGMMNESGTESDAKAITDAMAKMQGCLDKIK